MLDYRKKMKHRVSAVAVTIGTGAMPAVGYVKEWYASASPPTNTFVLTAFQYVDSRSIWLLSAGLALVVLGNMFKGGDPRVTQCVQEQLDTLQSKAFPNHQGDHETKFRVTLFRWYPWSIKAFIAHRHEMTWRFWRFRKWPWAGWIIPLMRSGRFRPPSGTYFFAPKNAADMAEGIAGQAWSAAGTKSALNLPSLNSMSSPLKKSRFCVSGFVPLSTVERYLETGKVLPRQIVGYQVLDSSGEVWGSLVIDSREENAIEEQTAYDAFTVVSRSLSVLVEVL